MPHARRLLRALSPAALLSLGVISCGDEPKANAPRNVILISIDTLRPDHLGIYGHDRDTSPTMDRLALEGVFFEDVTASSPWTLPSHASMFTGLYPSSHGVVDHAFALRESTPTLATAFSKAGFQTGALVNSENIANPKFKLLKGFGENIRYYPEIEESPGGVDSIVNRGEEITAGAMEWIGNRDERPFFLFLHYYDVHTDFTPKPEYEERFVSDYPGPLTGLTTELVAVRTQHGRLRDIDIRYLRQMYDAEIRQLDDLLGVFVGFLGDQDLLENTLIVVTSDHGEEYFEHGGVLHGRTQYQELLAIPLIFSGPGVPVGRSYAEPAHLVDVAPTILSIAGVDPLGGFAEGLDLSIHWRDPSAVTSPRVLYAEADHNNLFEGRPVVDIKKMVRVGNDKLLYDTARNQVELYDLATDPGEKNDLARVNPDRSRFLMGQLEAFMGRSGTGSRVPGLDRDDLERMRKLGYVDVEDPQ